MDRRSLEIVPGKSEGIIRLQQAVMGESGLDNVKGEGFIREVHALLEFDGFVQPNYTGSFISTVVRPFQGLMAVASIIKRTEGMEMSSCTRDPRLLELVPSPGGRPGMVGDYSHLGGYFRDRWNINLMGANKADLWRVRHGLEQVLISRFEKMLAEINRLERSKLVQGVLSVNGRPILFNVLLALFEQLREAILDLKQQFTQVSCSLNLLFSKLPVDQRINDSALEKTNRLLTNMRLVVEKLRTVNGYNSMEVLEQLLDEAKVYPSYNPGVLDTLVSMRLPAYDPERLKEDFDRDRKRNFSDFKGLEEEKIDQAGDSFKVEITDTVDAELSQISLLVRGRAAQNVGMDLKRNSKRGERLIVAENLEQALGAVSARIWRRKELLEILDVLLVEDSIEEAEMIQRVYLLANNRFDFNEDSDQQAERFELWKKGKLGLKALLQQKRRSAVRLSLVTAPSPAATTASTETSATESTPAAKTTKPA